MNKCVKISIEKFDEFDMQMADKIATGFYESKDHWQGLSDTTTTKHMAAGITYKNGKYWTCIVYGDDITASYG